jgi:hypothetical protein
VLSQFDTVEEANLKKLIVTHLAEANLKKLIVTHLAKILPSFTGTVG